MSRRPPRDVVLVTGGSGFVGRHVVRRLSRAGHRVRVADLVPSPDPGAETVVGDLTDPDVRSAALGPDVAHVVHLAARTSVLGSVADPITWHRTNVEATAGLLELARRRGVASFALASTNAVAGDTGGRVIDERVPVSPLTPYGATKAAAEALCSGYAHAYGIRIPLLRLTNVHGPGVEVKDGLVARLLRAAGGGAPVTVFGDGSQVRDYVHVEDVADAFAAAVADWPTGPVVVGRGASASILEVAATVRDVTGAPLPLTHRPVRAGEMPAVVVDTTRAGGRGFRAVRSLRDGVRAAWPAFDPVPV